jgi:hypothetical protein
LRCDLHLERGTRHARIYLDCPTRRHACLLSSI